MTTNNSDNTNIGLGYSPDALAERKAELLNLLGQVAPELLSDNQLNFDKLKDLLAGDIADLQEHYELNWAGKAAARREIQKTTSSTLLPDPNNPAQAQHMLIEGENLEVLRVLQKSYYGKVKMIYIDPPYNTGNDSFVYPDDYSETLDEYLKRTGEKNEDGYLNKQSLWKKNSKESGQYHSAWLSMMYPRLYLARNLLRDDGVIFISIDDNEITNLSMLCKEIFGDENVEIMVWNKESEGSSGTLKSVRTFRRIHEYVIACYKNIASTQWNKINEALAGREDEFQTANLAVNVENENMEHENYFTVTNPNGLTFTRHWKWSKSEIERLLSEDLIYWGSDGNKQPRLVIPLDDRRKTYLLSILNYGGTTVGKKDFAAIMQYEADFTYPKPLLLIQKLTLTVMEKHDIILDFFAGSGTTAHAVMELNAEDGGNRQSISIQLPELLDEKSEAYKAGYRSIADITRARIEKVIAKLKAEKPEQTQDLACAHFKLAPSNFKVWRSDLADVDAVRSQLEMFQQAEKSVTPNVHKDDSNQQAMLTELLLKNGLGALGVHAISKPKTLASGMIIHRVLMSDDRLLWLCFDAYQQGFKDEVIKANPAQVIMLNSCFNSQGDKADEHISNLQLELGHHGIALLII